MSYPVDLFELTEKIDPLAFTKYLKNTGWDLLFRSICSQEKTKS